MNIKQNTPKGSLGIIKGLHYKIGHLGFAYYHDGEQWIKSDRHADYIVEAIESKRNPFSYVD